MEIALILLTGFCRGVAVVTFTCSALDVYMGEDPTGYFFKLSIGLAALAVSTIPLPHGGTTCLKD